MLLQCSLGNVVVVLSFLMQPQNLFFVCLFSVSLCLRPGSLAAESDPEHFYIVVFSLWFSLISSAEL